MELRIREWVKRSPFINNQDYEPSDRCGKVDNNCGWKGFCRETLTQGDRTWLYQDSQKLMGCCNS
ncbi:MAG TPA: hypothetical protein V6D16_04250 [Candidatus Obscuribacterales bacterium]